MGTKLRPLNKRNLQAWKTSVLIRLMALWSGTFNLAPEIITNYSYIYIYIYMYIYLYIYKQRGSGGYGVWEAGERGWRLRERGPKSWDVGDRGRESQTLWQKGERLKGWYENNFLIVSGVSKPVHRHIF